ncbi:pumilio homolog 12-like [Rutidosis leptorrhynchoides]|uniref:pumilio homolog 12-like n=1 Tax=Rutidosis leptorrhynchoides TaxID=125765 RepID=UPI003A9A3054
MNQTPPAPQSPQHYGFPSLNLPPSLDVDQSLSDALLSLNLSHNDGRMFLPPSLDNEYGGVESPIAGEGFVSPYRSNNNNQGFYSGVGSASHATVDPFLRRHNYPVSNYSSSGVYCSGFDPTLDFDQRSNYLLPKQRFNSSQHLNLSPNLYSSNPNVSSSRESCINLPNQQFFKVMPLKELRGMICLLARDQNGSKILQSKFENPTIEEIEVVLFDVLGSIADLMKDQFGSYVIQKLVCVCNDDQKTLIIRELIELPNDIILVCMSSYGTRAIQKLLENLQSPNQIMMVIRALHRDGAASLAIDTNGHHVIQFCLLHYDTHFNQLLLDDIANNCFKVATDRSGCCVMQACVEHSCGEVRNHLVGEIMNNAIQIAEDPFGNYVLQHMVGLKSPELTELLVRHLQGHFAYLSQSKYASNVVERCLTESGPEISSKIILELVRSPNSASLLVDPYGNFVIQSALKVSKGFAHQCLRKLISGNVTAMQSNLYGKKILEKLEKRIRAVHI